MITALPRASPIPLQSRSLRHGFAHSLKRRYVHPVPVSSFELDADAARVSQDQHSLQDISPPKKNPSRPPCAEPSPPLRPSPPSPTSTGNPPLSHSRKDPCSNPARMVLDARVHSARPLCQSFHQIEGSEASAWAPCLSERSRRRALASRLQVQEDRHNIVVGSRNINGTLLNYLPPSLLLILNDCL